MVGTKTDPNPNTNFYVPKCTMLGALLDACSNSRMLRAYMSSVSIGGTVDGSHICRII